MLIKVRIQYQQNAYKLNPENWSKVQQIPDSVVKFTPANLSQKLKGSQIKL